MKKRSEERNVKIAISTALAVCVVGSVVALGACVGGRNLDIKYSYTPEIGNGKTYYVSADVAQFTASSCDGSYENPYNILDLVGYGSSGTHSDDSILKAGDTVLVMPGVYEQETSVYVEKSGTYDNYITIMNAAYANDGHKYDSTSATISLYGEQFDGNARGVTINSDYIYWYGIDVAGAGDNGMYIGGNHNVIENCQFYNNRDTGLQLGRKQSADTDIKDWPSYNLIKNCTSFNNYDNHTYGENADGFGAKLTIGYGNMFDGCIAYRNSDDGWDLYAKEDTGNIGCVIIYNCMAFENGYLMDTQANNNARFGSTFSSSYAEDNTNSYVTRDGDGNGFKLGGGSNEGDVKLYNCISFNNRMHGVTDNSNPGTLQIDQVTSYNNCASIDNNSSSSTFGQVKYDGGTEDADCANIDLSRWAYSYNTMSNVLSVIDGNSCTAADAYRGATTNSMFSNYYVEGTIDADTKNEGGVRGTSYSSKPSGSVFVETPSLDLGVRTTFNDEGTVKLGAGNIHEEMREEDGTIDAGDILKIKEDANLVLDGVGADLSKTSWDAYEHYEYTCGQSSKSAEADKLAAISNMIYLPVYEDAVFQNFKVVNSIWGVDINWSSSDEEVLKVTNNVRYTTSQSSTVDIEVNRDAEGDKEVTLTAEISYEGKKAEKRYDLIVRKDIPSIGDVLVDGVEYDQAIVDQYAAFPEPEVTVENGSDYNGKTLDESLYTIERKYEYAKSATGVFDEVGTFTTSNAGVYKITLEISINDPDALAAVTTKTYTYMIYVASKDAEVAFTENPTLTVYRDGYEICGDLSSPTGYSYVLKTTEEITGEGENGEILATQIIENNDTVMEEFRDTTLTLQYEEENANGYYVYCVLTSLDGSQLSAVYEMEAKVENISSTEDFIGMINSNNSHTIYLLQDDLDFENVTYTASGSFSGLLNGLGHTVKNISTANRAVFDTVKGGTIENIKFDSVSIEYSGASSSGTGTSAGLIGLMQGGYLYNIAATDLSVESNGQRVGGIVGQVNVSSGGNTLSTYIDFVSLENTYTHSQYETDEDGSLKVEYTGAAISGSERVGGIVGFIQAGGTDSWNKVYISNCYVNAFITSSGGVAGGIVGRSDDRNSGDILVIDSCYVYSLVESTSSGKSYLGGIIGQFTGTGYTCITRCMSYGWLWFGNENIGGSLKNASLIVGNFAANGNIEVTSCYARFAEYNEEYGVSSSSIRTTSLSDWQSYTPIEMESSDGTVYWEFVTNSNNIPQAPYLRLVFQGEWNLTDDTAE